MGIDENELKEGLFNRLIISSFIDLKYGSFLQFFDFARNEDTIFLDN